MDLFSDISSNNILQLLIETSGKAISVGPNAPFYPKHRLFNLSITYWRSQDVVNRGWYKLAQTLQITNLAHSD